MALTRITKGVIKPNENYDTHDINSTGIITATGANITGNLSVGGVLTYEDVTSIDSVGIITAQKDIHVGAGISAVGIITAASFRGDGSQLSGVGIDTSQLDVNKLDVTGIATFKGGLSLIAPTGDYPSITAIDGNDKLTLRSNGLLVNNQNGFRGLEYTGSSIHLYSGQMASHTLVLQTDAKGVKVGTGVTLETNGQATFSGIVTASSFSGSGANLTSVNADTVDGIQAASFVRSDATDTLTGEITLSNNLIKFSGTSNDRTVMHFIKSGEIKWRLLQNSFNAGGGDNLNFDRVNGTGIFMVDGYRVLTTSDINAQASGAVHSGISTFQDIDVDGHTELDNVNIVGVTTHNGQTKLYGNGGASAIWGDTGYSGHLSFDGSNNAVIRAASGKALIFQTNHVNERLRINSTGEVLVGTPNKINTSPSKFQVAANDATGSAIFARFNASVYSSYLDFYKSRNNTLGSATVVNNNDHLGSIRFYGADGSNSGYTTAAEIYGSCDGGSSASGDMPGRITFHTRPDGAGQSMQERLRIDSSGIVTINYGNPTSNGIFKIAKDSNGEAQLRFETASANTASIVLGTDEELKFKYGGTEVLRIKSDGKTGIGEDNPDRKLHVKSGANSNDGAFRIESAPGNIMDMGTDSSSHFLNCVNNDPFRLKFAGNEALRVLQETSGNWTTELGFYLETSQGQGARPYIKAVAGTEAGSNDASNAGGFEFHTKTGGSGTDVNAMRINANGRVAIGAHNIQNPTAALHIIGDTSGSNTALQVGQDSGQRYLRVNEISGQSNFGDLTLSFYDNTMPSLLKLQNTYAAAANMGTAIQFIGHGGGQTGKISVYNRDANSSSNTVMELSASYITKPSHPYFDVSRSSGTVSATNVVVYNNVYINNGNHYSSSNGRFTAPVDGHYQFWYGHIKQNTNSVVRAKWRKNGGSYLHGNRELRMDDGGPNYGDNGAITIITYLNKNDYVEVVVTAGTIYGTAPEYGYACGTLLG